MRGQQNSWGPRSHGSHVVFLPTVLSAPSLWALRQKLPGLSQALADRQTVAFSTLTAKGAGTLPAPLGLRSGFRSRCCIAHAWEHHRWCPKLLGLLLRFLLCSHPPAPWVLSSKKAKELRGIYWCLRVLPLPSRSHNTSCPPHQPLPPRPQTAPYAWGLRQEGPDSASSGVR